VSGVAAARDFPGDQERAITMITSLRAQDLLVGSVAIVIGLLSLAVAVINWSWFYQLRLARRCESRWGRRGARVYYFILGSLLILLGLAIALGRIPHR
jgi:hypothetical protein